ncbi:putative Secreted esterase [Streptomyces viridochromogenes Tue57]|uniref:Putative Secreted esterase n=1 Tax=Streptomyces viridochromogenes Tue57 TaxID=1160705 RepID=L8PAJ1_STRVR|nr:putative Secreted esterase [Streptomyces viridochromogenes Tue57]
MSPCRTGPARAEHRFVWHFKSSPALIVTPNGTGAFGNTYLGTDGTNAGFGSGFAN